MSDVRPDQRCRLTRAVSHGEIMHQRGTEVTVTKVQENLGRTLISARLDSGERLALFTGDIEPIATKEA